MNHWHITMRNATTFNWAGLLLLAAALAACSKVEPPAEPVRAVKIMTVGLQQADSALEYAGEVRARVESRLGFRIGGKLAQRPVALGQHVQAGQVLAQLDPQDLNLAADAARAQLAAARANHDLAAAEFQRYQALKDQNFISGAELERREAALKAARAQLAQAQAQGSAQGNQASYASLRADVAGVITAVLAEPGQVLAVGAPVLILAQDGPRDVLIAVPEDKVAAIKLGAQVQVRRWSGPGTLKAVVREVAASADPVTRTFAVKVGLRAGDDLALGSTVSVLSQTPQPTGAVLIKLPTSALWQQGQASAVWVLDTASMTVRPQIVQIATADGNDVVVASGLQPGMQVVVAGVHVLSSGQKVTRYQDGQPL